MPAKPKQEHVIEVGSNRLAYERVGEGPDVVFVHGWPLNRTTWRNVVPAMSGYTCHLFDLPGMGRSAPATAGITFANLTDATVGLIDHLGLERFALVGHDSGGLIARRAAAACGDRVRGLVITGTEVPGHHPKMLDMLASAVRLPGSNRVLRTVLGSRRLTASKFVFGGTMLDRSKLEGDFRRLLIDPLTTDKAATQRSIDYLRAYSPAEVDKLTATHAQITAPTLAVWGKRDPFFPVAKARAMMAEFAGPTEFEVIDDARLLVHEEHPERFAELCSAFLAEHLAAV